MWVATPATAAVATDGSRSRCASRAVAPVDAIAARFAPRHADPPLAVAERERERRDAGDEVEQRREGRPAEVDARTVEGEHAQQADGRARP